MGSLNIFSACDVRQCSGQLFKDAEHGRLAVITKLGRPAILAVRFDQRLVEVGIHRAMALRLFEQRQATLVQAARLAERTPEEFVVLLDAAGIPAVDCPLEELDDEVGVAS
ncbi:MAG: prevent-host-death family protein [Acidobacteria bacterium]|nr:prevent-host-death family protein [Acidobacteriota bacterium]MYH31921.1 prevent-host-death family protein [Acidobacteriota bacterium]MYK86914.1 prevent-host-death family protein [Acidobacteriota bacterium]